MQTTHDVRVINLSKARLKNGVNSLRRVVEVMGITWQIWRQRNWAEVIYFTISESGAGNLKDLLIYSIFIKRLGRVMIHLHGGAGMKQLMERTGSAQTKINRFFLSRLGGVVILGRRHRSIFSGIVADLRLHIVPNFAQDYLFVLPSQIIAKFERRTPLRLLYLSNLIPGKGYEELLAAFLRLEPGVRSVIRIDFAGAFESETDKLRFLGKISMCGNIAYHGVVSGESKRDLLAQAHVFCLPTYYPYEGQPISILEAYASGCTVVTTDHSGILDIFEDKVNGYQVAKQSVDELSRVLSNIVENPQELLAFSLRNRQIAERKFRVSIFNQTMSGLIKSM